MGKPSPRLTAPRPRDVLDDALRQPPPGDDVAASGRAARCPSCTSVYAVEYQDARCPHSLLETEEDAEGQEIARRGVLQACREDVNDFCAYVLRDEETHGRIEQQPMHVTMHAVLQQHGRAVIMAHPESGKSSQISVGRVLWLLGKNPELRLALICNTQTAAKKILRLIKLYIESSKELHEVFPELLPGRQWTEDQITVRRPNLSRDPTVQTLGYHGDIQGSRLDGVVADDLLDFENTRNTNIRHEVASWWKSAVMGRLTMRAWVAFLTNAWHQDDLAHELERMGWPTLRFPIYDESGRSTWPARWPISRIEAKRTTEMGELAFTRLFLCKPRDDGAIVFLPAAIAKCKRNGQGYGLVDLLDDATSQRLEDAGAMVVTGVDLAVTRRLRGGITCAFTLLLHPDGTRQVLGIRSGRWGGREILANLSEVGAAYGGVIVVEDNGAQRYLVELAQETGESHVPVPVVPFYTGANKADPQLGINSMAAEFEAGRWVIPVGVGVMRGGERVYVEPAEVRAWVGEMLAFDPDSHPGDRLMASWIARAYGARRMRRKAQGGASGVSVQAIG